MPSLKLRITKSIHESYELEGAVTLGRGDDCDIVLLDTSISRRHAVIMRQGDRYAIVDNKSANGVLVNDVKVERHLLEEGDLISLGKKRLVFTVESPITAEPGTTIDLTKHPLANYPMSEIVQHEDVLMIIPTIEPLMEMIYEITAHMVQHTALSETDQDAFIFAAQEAMRNAAKYGNEFNPGKVIRFRFVKDPYKVMAVVTDEGPGFDYRSMLDRAREMGRDASSTSELPAGVKGAGVLKMLWNVDRVEFNKEGNEIFLTRYVGSSEEATKRRQREKWKAENEDGGESA